MTNVPGQPQNVTPERQIAATQVASVFASIHNYIATLQHKDEQGNALMTEFLRNAHARVKEASLWAIEHVLAFGPVPTPLPAANEANPVINDAPEAAQPTANASGTESV
jgi:hypothetical protein